MSWVRDYADGGSVTIALDPGGTSQQRAWADDVVGGRFNITPERRDKPIHGSLRWLDDNGRHFWFDQIPRSRPRFWLAKNEQPWDGTEAAAVDVQLGNYDAVDVLIRWVDEPPCPGHSEFACTQSSPFVSTVVESGRYVINVRRNLDDPARPAPWTGKDFYQETIAHELAHVTIGILMEHVGEDAAKEQLTALFGGGPWNTGPWEGQVVEATAEFFKDMVWPTRKFDARTTRKLPRANFAAFKKLMVDRVLVPPASQRQWHTTFVNNLDAAMWRGFDRQHYAESVPADPVPGDLYEVFQVNAGDGVLRDAVPGMETPNLKGYMVYADDGERSSSMVIWAGRRYTYNAQGWRDALPTEPPVVDVLYDRGLKRPEQAGLTWGSFTHTDFTISAEWLSADYDGMTPWTVFATTPVAHITAASPPNSRWEIPLPDLAGVQSLAVRLYTSGVFPVVVSHPNVTTYLGADVVLSIPWRYRDDLVGRDMDPLWLDPRWPYGGLLPGTVAAGPAPAGAHRHRRRVIAA